MTKNKRSLLLRQRSIIEKKISSLEHRMEYCRQSLKIVTEQGLQKQLKDTYKDLVELYSIYIEELVEIEWRLCYE